MTEISVMVVRDFSYQIYLYVYIGYEWLILKLLALILSVLNVYMVFKLYNIERRKSLSSAEVNTYES